MQETATTQPILDHARQQEKEYDWLGAVESYKKAQVSIPDNEQSSAAKFAELAGYACYKAALQADTSDEFKERIRSAISSFKEADEAYKKVEEGHEARELRCRAWIDYLNFWLATEPSSKKKLLIDSWELTKNSLTSFKKDGDLADYGSTYNKASMIIGLVWLYEDDPRALERTFQEAVDHGKLAIQSLSKLGDPDELAKAHVNTASFLQQAKWFTEKIEEQESYEREETEHWTRAKDLSPETAALEMSFFSYGFTGFEGSDEALRNWRKSMELGKKTRDKLIVGSALTLTAYHTVWNAIGTEDPDKRVRLMDDALKFAHDCKHQLSPLGLPSPITAVLWPGAPDAEYHWILGTWESDLEKKHALWTRALKEAPEMLREAQNSGYPQAMLNAHHVFSKALASAAKIEVDSQKRKEMLGKAFEERTLCITISSQIEPYNYFNLGVYQHYSAEIASELSDLATDPKEEKILLEEAIRLKEAGIEFYHKMMMHLEGQNASNLAWIGERMYEHGNMLNRLYDLGEERRLLEKAIDAFTEASDIFRKANILGRRAECYWRMSQTHDALNNHLKAAETFLQASESYKAAAEKLPQLKELYTDHASYLEAWSAIETARHHHAKEEYGKAEEYYNKAAELHRSTNRWKTLTSNYLAWARLERAENLSRKDQSLAAATAFREAAELFEGSRKDIQAGSGRAWQEEEKAMLSKLAMAADRRIQYCSARILLENARNLDKRGEYHQSAEEYGFAADAMEQILGEPEPEQTKKEMKLIVVLSRAWQFMARAEAEVSPNLYLEASRLFEEAKELSSSEKARMLALGHSRFCRALEAGTKFADTGDETLRSSAIQQLESAANYYVRAGFQNASDYAEACKLLFDAYACMNKANREDVHEAKAKLFVLAEKMLASSADLFAKAGQSGRKDQVSQLLGKVKAERDLATSFTDIFHAPPVVSTTATFGTPTPAFEKAVGLDRFEHADVQASILTHQKDVKVGESLEVEIELVNAGKGAAQLVKVEQVVPEGFELTKKPEFYRVEDHYLNMRGKRLDPLKTEEVRLTLRPRAQGLFKLNPRILYLDEGGKYKSHEPEPVDITVKELGITGWLKGR